MPAHTTAELAQLIKLDNDGVHVLHEVLNAVFEVDIAPLDSYRWEWRPELHAFYVTDERGRVRCWDLIIGRDDFGVTDVKSGQKTVADPILLRKRLMEPVNFIGDHDHTPPNPAIPAFQAIIRAVNYFLLGPRVARNELAGPPSEDRFAEGRPPVVHALLNASHALNNLIRTIQNTHAPHFILRDAWAMLKPVDKLLYDFCADPRHPLRKHMAKHGLIDREGFEIKPEPAISSADGPCATAHGEQAPSERKSERLA